MKRLHIGCGTIYLQDWINVEIQATGTFLAPDRPDLVERYRTTEDQYYARHKDKNIRTLRTAPKTKRPELVCDMHGDFTNLPIPANSVDEILARQCFEHLSITEAHKALDSVDEVLKVGGILRLDVPDHDEALDQLVATKDPFYKRHLQGPRNGEHGAHMMGYTRESLRGLAEEHGFRFLCEEPNIHVYPAFCLRFEKPGLPVPFEYISLPEIPDDWKVLEVGPGPYPFPRADVVVDRDPANLEGLGGREVICADFADGLPQFTDKEFDYVYCSHVLEHVEDPLACAKTLSRIAKRGTIVMPSAIKEGLFAFEEPTHQWLVLPHPTEGAPPVFVRHSPSIEQLKDIEIQRSLCRLFRTGPNRLSEEQRYMRNWFRRNEVNLDVVVHWTDELVLQVIQ
jgi:predicted SAM-dependent methyltransferase